VGEQAVATGGHHEVATEWCVAAWEGLQPASQPGGRQAGQSGGGEAQQLRATCCWQITAKQIDSALLFMSARPMHTIA
jgi:hypothetical protein